MKLTIDKLDSTTGWTGTGTVVAYGINQIPDFIAGFNTGSIVFKFPENSSGQSITKIISPAIDVSLYNNIVFHLWSRNESNNGVDYNLSTDFKYKIEFGTTDVFYMPTFEKFNDLTFDITGVNSITKIKITCLHNSEDYIIVSNMIACKDEIPVDIFRGTQEQIQNEINGYYSKITNGVNDKGILCGTVTAIANDKFIDFESNYPWIEPYAVILIDDGTNHETHQISKTDEKYFYFNSMYDGAKLKYSYTNANVYITFPVNYGVSEDEISLPGITIWGMNPEEGLMHNKMDEERDSFKTDETVKTMPYQGMFEYTLLVDCEARHNELVAHMSRIVRAVISKNYIWVNGKKVNIFPEGASTYIEPMDGFNQIPKIQYTFKCEVHEDIFDRTTIVKTIDNNLTVDISTELLS